jgi:hypothetical protein
MKMPEVLFMCGLASTSLASGLLPFPLFGLVGRGLLPVTLVILVAAFALLPVTAGVPLWRRRGVFVLYLVAVALAIVIAGEASLMAHDALVFSHQSDFEKVTTFEWILIGLSTLLPASLFFLSVHLRSTWSEKRCLLWTVVLLLVCPVGIGIFRLLALFLPLTA